MKNVMLTLLAVMVLSSCAETTTEEVVVTEMTADTAVVDTITEVDTQVESEEIAE
jgi:hypothetical protein